MLRLAKCKSFPSQHLIVIPTSTRGRVPERDPVNTAELSRVLSRLLHVDSLSRTEQFTEAAVHLSRNCGHRELRKLVMVMDIHSIFSAELKRCIVDRIMALGPRVPLGTLLTVYSKFSNPSIMELIKARIGSGELMRLSNNKMVSVVGLVPDNGLVMSEITKRIKELDSSQIATTLNGLKNLGRSTPAIERYREKALRDMARRLSLKQTVSARDLSLIFNAIGELGSASFTSDITKALVNYALPCFTEYTPVQQALILHSLAKLGTMDFRLFDVFAANFKPINFKAYSKAVGMILYAMGKCEFKNDSVLLGFSELIKRDIPSFNLQSIALSCYGFSRLGYLPLDLLDVVSAEIIYRSTVKRNSKSFNYTIADIGMVAKAFSQSTKRTGREFPELSYTLMELLKHHPGRRKDIPAPTVEGVVSIMEAFSTLDRSKVVGFDFWISKNLHPIVHQLSSIQIYSVLSSMIKMGINNKPLYTAVIEAINPDVVEYILVPKLLMKMSKIPSHATVVDSQIVKQLSKIFSVNLIKYSEMFDLVGMMYGLSELNHRDDKLVDRMIAAVGLYFEKDNWIDESLLPMLAVSCARLRITDSDFNNKLYGKIFKHINSLESERSVTNVLYAIATSVGSGDMDPADVHWVNPMVDELLGRLVVSRDLPLEAIRQVQIVGLWLRYLRGSRTIPKRIDAWLDQILAVNTFISSSVEQSSESHREISRYLLQLGLTHTNETVFGPFSLDIYVPDCKTVIEVDGPHHFFRDTVLRTSSSVLKHKLLECMGYRVVHVPFQEWTQCTTDSRKLAYCNSLAELVKTSI